MYLFQRSVRVSVSKVTGGSSCICFNFQWWLFVYLFHRSFMCLLQLNFLVQKEILSARSTRSRADIMAHFIKVAKVTLISYSYYSLVSS